MGNLIKSMNGSALNVLILNTKPVDGKVLPSSILGRGSYFNYTRRFSVSETEELNTTCTQETNYGKELVGNGRITTIFTLKNNDQFPSADSIRSADELLILEITGDDNVMNDPTAVNPFVVVNAFIGARITGESSSDQVSQTKMQDVDFLFRRKLSGAQWKALYADAVYPAD